MWICSPAHCHFVSLNNSPVSLNLASLNKVSGSVNNTLVSQCLLLVLNNLYGYTIHLGSH